jgi:hypothetical protein
MSPLKIRALFESDATKFARNFRDAQGYHQRARQFADQQRGASLIFNVASLAIECYLIALCSYFKTMPFNHNYNALMDAAAEVITFTPQLSQQIRALDTIFGICSLENYHHGTPETADAESTLTICAELAAMFQTHQLTADNMDAA